METTVKPECNHPNSYLKEPCCKTPGESGNIECGCKGLPQLICPDCPATSDEILYGKEES